MPRQSADRSPIKTWCERCVGELWVSCAKSVSASTSSWYVLPFWWWYRTSWRNVSAHLSWRRFPPDFGCMALALTFLYLSDSERIILFSVSSSFRSLGGATEPLLAESVFIQSPSFSMPLAFLTQQTDQSTDKRPVSTFTYYFIIF